MQPIAPDVNPLLLSTAADRASHSHAGLEKHPPNADTKSIMLFAIPESKTATLYGLIRDEFNA